MMRRTLVNGPAVLLILLAGCGGSDLMSVSGTVTFNGRPLETGTVTFLPIGNGPVGYGTVQSNGSYRVRTGTESGLPPGEYQVTVVATGPMPKPTAENPEPLPESLIPNKYGSPTVSGLRYTVTGSGSRYDIILQEN